MEDGSTYRVGPGSVFAIPTPVKHDLVNVGKETLRAVAFFAAAMFTQNFDNVMMPPKNHILGTPITLLTDGNHAHSRALPFRLWWFARLCGFAWFWRSTTRCSAGKIVVGNRKKLGFSK